MSLVNDMLRDLDSRRKDSAGGSASVSLTPAPEMVPETARRSLMLYLVLALMVGAGIVAWFWLQQDGAGATRELDIAPRLAFVEESAPTRDDTDPVSATEDPVAERNVAQVADDSQAIAPVEISEAAVEPEPETEQPASVQSTAVVESSTIREATEVAVNEPANNVLERAEDVIEVAPVDEPVAASEEPEGEGSSADIASTTRDLSQPPVEDVKNASERTPEERDVLAVQSALQFIAENNLTAAYVTGMPHLTGPVLKLVYAANR